jgi:hypothetical protein
VTAVVEGPAWSVRGLVQHGSRYPLKVEGAVQRPVGLLLPGVSTASELVRYFALYAALAAYAGERGIDADGCRELVRRSEVVMAAASAPDGGEPADGIMAAHAADGVRPWLGDDGLLDVRGAVNSGHEQHSYSPRKWGFWETYGGPSQALGTVERDGRALRAGRHPCPERVRGLFGPLLAAAARDRLTAAELQALRPAGMLGDGHPENPWLMELFTATRAGVHEPGDWLPDDRRRRGTMRILARATVLHGTDTDLTWTEAVESTVVFGGALEEDPVLSGIGEAEAWRGLLLRNYSVSAWRRLWAALVSCIGTADEHADRSAAELQAWLADQMPDMTTGAFIDGELPATTQGGKPAAAERAILSDSPQVPLTDVKVLLPGAQRSEELTGEARTVFLGHLNEILNPAWVSGCAREFRARPLRDLAVRLVNDMLAQANRVALEKLAPDASGRLQAYSRVFERNGRYYKTGGEGDGALGTRLEVIAGIAVQLGLITLAPDGTATVTGLGSAVLEAGG